MLALPTRTTNVSCYVRRWKDWQEISSTNRNDNFAFVFLDIANNVPNGILPDVNSIQSKPFPFWLNAQSSMNYRQITTIKFSSGFNSHPFHFIRFTFYNKSSRLASIFLVQYWMQDEIFIDARISVSKEKRHDDELLNEITLKATRIQSVLGVTPNASQLTPWQLTHLIRFPLMLSRVFARKK